ncbi:MAG: hypothetical protein JSR46_07805 [Verrucomicrobia bacterium]|nr:hypothetical protein [Verrucomicrobiota bacterium]
MITDSLNDLPTNFANAISLHADKLQKKFEEKRSCDAQAGDTYTALTSKASISLCWYVVDTKITVTIGPLRDRKPTWVTEVCLGDEQQVQDADESFIIYRRPIIDITITSQHEENERFFALKKAYVTALERIKKNNQPVSVDVVEAVLEPVETVDQPVLEPIETEDQPTPELPLEYGLRYYLAKVCCKPCCGGLKED